MLRIKFPLKAALVLLLAPCASLAIEAKRHACSLHHFMCKQCDPETFPSENASATPIRRLLAAGGDVALEVAKHSGLSGEEATHSGLRGKRYALNRHHHGSRQSHHSGSAEAEAAAAVVAANWTRWWEMQHANWTSPLMPAHDAQSRRVLKEKFMGRGR